MNLVVNLRPDSNEKKEIDVPLVDPTTGLQIVTNGVPQTRTVINPMYVPNRGKASIVIYAKNHNVLRIVNGFAGLLFKI
jgi:hypothetical protein